jgi:hypothetical protein
MVQRKKRKAIEPMNWIRRYSKTKNGRVVSRFSKGEKLEFGKYPPSTN